MSRWLALSMVVGWAGGAHAAALPEWTEALLAQSPHYRGLISPRDRTAADYGDLDGDGINEVVVAFKERGEAAGVRGGLLVLGSRDGRLVKVYAGVWRSAFPRAVAISGRNLEVTVVRQAAAGEITAAQTLVYGRDLRWEAVPAPKLDASSTLSARRAKTSVAAVLDGDLATGWAEDSLGTGVGEWLRLDFGAPIDVAWLGLAGGNHTDRASWRRCNRIRRALVVVRTPSEEGDPRAGVSYAAMGLAFEGQGTEIALPDEMGLTYVPIDRATVRSLEIRLRSVYLGDRLDDAWIAEVDFVAALPEPPEPSFVISPAEAPGSR